MPLVDERIVRMEFDNAAFEKGVSQTMSSLDAFKKSLNFEDSAKGFDEITKASSKVSFDGISSGLETVKEGFSSLEAFTFGIFERLGQRVADFGANMVKSLTVDQVNNGFNEYELKVGAVQNILAATEAQGETIETVSGYLEELNEYSDRTIYSFSDMTSNIGKFTNAGVKLEDAVLAMKGISNEAALSGANSTEAARAMYNLSQAMSLGYMQRMDWKSIENANMATMEFKTNLVKAAIEMKKLDVSALDNIGLQFTENLKNGWLTNEVMLKVLKEYADETTDLGARAYRSAQEVKTISMLFDTMKEAVQSGWAQTFELIIGNKDEAVKTLTKINDVVDVFISKSVDARNSVLKTFMEITAPGRNLRFEIGDFVKNIVKLITRLIEITRTGISKTFRSLNLEQLGQKFFNVSMAFNRFVHGFDEGEEKAIKLEKIVNTLANIIKIPANLISQLGEKFLNTAHPILDLGKRLIDWVTDFITHFQGLASALANFKFFETEEANFSLLNLKRSSSELFEYLFSWAIKLKDFVVEIFYKYILPTSKKAYDYLKERFINDFIPYLKKSLVDFYDSLTKKYDDLKNRFNTELLPSLKAAFEELRNELTKITGYDFNTLWENIKNVFSKIEGLYNTIKSGIESIYDKIKDFVIKKFVDIGWLSMEGAEVGFSEKFKSVKDSVVGFFSKILESVKDFLGIHSPARAYIEIGENSADGYSSGMARRLSLVWSEIKKAFEKIKEKVLEWSDKFSKWAEKNGLIQYFKNLYTELGGIVGIINLILRIKWANAFSDFAKGIKNFSEGLDGLFDAFKDEESFATKLVKIASAFAILAAGIYILGSIKQENIDTIKELGTLIGVVATVMVAGFIKLLPILIKFSSGLDTLDKITNYIVKISISAIPAALAFGWIVRQMNLLLPTLKDFIVGVTSLEKPITEAIDALVWVSLLIAGIIALSRFAKGFKLGTGLAFIGVAAFIFVLSKIVDNFDSINDASGNLKDGYKTLLLLSAIVGGIMLLGSNFKASAGLGLLMVLGAMIIFEKVALYWGKIYTESTWETLNKGLAVLGMVGLILGLVAFIAKLAAPSGKAALAIMGIAASLIALSFCLKIIDGVESKFYSVLSMGAITLLLMGLIDSVATLTKGKNDKEIKEISKMFLVMAVSLTVMFAALTIILSIIQGFTFSDFASSFSALFLILGSIFVTIKTMETALINLSKAGVSNARVLGFGIIILSIIGVMTAAVLLLSAVDLKGFINSLAWLGLGIGAFEVVLWTVVKALQILDDNKISTAKVLALGTIIVGIIGALALIPVLLTKFVDYENFSSALIAMGAGVAAFLVIALILIGVGKMGASAAPSMLAFGATLISLGLSILAIAGALALIASVGPTGVDVIVYFLTSIINLIPVVVEKVLDGVDYLITWILEKIPEFLKTLNDNVPAFCYEVVRLIVNIFYGLAKAIHENQQLISDAIYEVLYVLFIELPIIIVDVLTKIIPDAINMLFVDLPRMIKRGFEAVDWADIAKSFLDFFVGAVKGTWNAIKDIGSWLGNLITGGTKDALGINSPSKEFEDIGGYCMEGLANGLTENEDLIDLASFDVGDNLKDAFGGIDLTSLFGDSADLNPTITPVLDLSNVEAGAGSISSLLGGSSLSLGGLDLSSGISGIMKNQNGSESSIIDTIMSKIGGALGDKLTSLGDKFGVDINSLGDRFEGMSVNIDGNALVGSISGKMNNALGKIVSRK